MKAMKKILALAAAGAMLLGMNAFAETLTIQDTRTGREYEAYQILTGDVSGTEENGYILSSCQGNAAQIDARGIKHFNFRYVYNWDANGKSKAVRAVPIKK